MEWTQVDRALQDVKLSLNISTLTIVLTTEQALSTPDLGLEMKQGNKFLHILNLPCSGGA